MLACRLFAASAVLSSLRVEICPPPVPKVMLVAVPPPVAPIVSVWPLSAGGVSCVVPAVRPSAVSVPALPPITRGVVVPVLRVSLVAPSVEVNRCTGDGVDRRKQVAHRRVGQVRAELGHSP